MTAAPEQRTAVPPSALLAGKLAAVRSKKVGVETGSGVAMLLGGLVLALGIGMAADWFLDLPWAVRLLLFLGYLAGAGHVIWHRILIPFLRQPDDDAPVSALFLDGRKQDFAFELPVGNSPRQRHHVRFWNRNRPKDGRPVWVGSATFDERVGLSHTTGQITHHIGPDVDAERDLIMTGLKKAGWVQREFSVDGFHQNPEGRNGGGDLWRTDGRLGAIVLRPDGPELRPA